MEVDAMDVEITQEREKQAEGRGGVGKGRRLRTKPCEHQHGRDRQEEGAFEEAEKEQPRRSEWNQECTICQKPGERHPGRKFLVSEDAELKRDQS